jgi:hypothetical protein
LLPCAAVPPPVAAAVEHAASVPVARMIAAIRVLGRPPVPSARIGGLLSRRLVPVPSLAVPPRGGNPETELNSVNLACPPASLCR